MKTWQLTLAACATALALGGCATGAQYRERQDAELALFQRHAGAPVDRIRTYFGIDGWKALSPTKLAIWTTVNRAYLLTLGAPCSGLEFQQSIAISSTNNTVHRRFDTVRFEHQTCFIDTIEPVDYKALKLARRADGEKSAMREATDRAVAAQD